VEHGIRRPTIADVARAASVSITTVSDAMSGKGRVDPATRQRVLDAAAAVGWQPRRAARSLRSGRTGTIALCIPPGRDQWAQWMRNSDYFQQLTASCAAAAVDAGLLLLLAPRPGTAAELANLDVDGMVVVDPLRDDPVVALCAAARVPVVTIDRQPDAAMHAWVGNDHVAGARLALDHLHARGSRRVALFTCAAAWSWFDDTRRAYDAWCAAHDLEPLVRTIDLDLTISTAAAALADLIAAGERPDGVLALPTSSALGVLEAAAAHGLRVPDDLRVVAGVDGVAMATAGVTALDLQPAELGQAAVAVLHDRILHAGATPPDAPPLVDAVLRLRATT
jgi:DNA-binding LacI/PurR family transcriptional regulator